jgi:hypothetical protein
VLADEVDRAAEPTGYFGGGEGNTVVRLPMSIQRFLDGREIAMEGTDRGSQRGDTIKGKPRDLRGVGDEREQLGSGAYGVARHLRGFGRSAGRTWLERVTGTSPAGALAPQDVVFRRPTEILEQLEQLRLAHVLSAGSRVPLAMRAKTYDDLRELRGRPRWKELRERMWFEGLRLPVNTFIVSSSR